MNLIFSTSILLSVPLAALSDTCDIIPDGGAVLLASKHVNAQHYFNEKNLGAFLSWECEGLSTRVGTYKNSFDRQSWAVTATHDFVSLSAGGFNVHPFAGFAHYPDTCRNEVVSIGGSDWIFIGGVELTHDDFPVFVQYLPGDKDLGGYDHLWTIAMALDF